MTTAWVRAQGHTHRRGGKYTLWDYILHEQTVDVTGCYINNNNNKTAVLTEEGINHANRHQPASCMDVIKFI